MNRACVWSSTPRAASGLRAQRRLTMRFLDRLAAVIRGDQPPAPLPQAPPSPLRRFPLTAVAAVIATAALALWLSGAFARPSAPPASDPTAKQDSPPPNQVIPPVQSQPDSSGTGGRANPSPAAPPVDKTLNHEPRGAVGPSPPPESRKATRGTSLLIDRIRSWLNRRPGPWDFAARGERGDPALRLHPQGHVHHGMHARGRGVLGRRKGTQGSHRSGFSDECDGSDAGALGGHDG